MASASYLLCVRHEDGATAIQVPIDRVGGHITVLDEGDLPWPIRNAPGAPPPSGKLPVFDEAVAQHDVEMTPVLIEEDLLEVAGSLLDFSQAITPGRLDVASAPLPIQLALEGTLALDLQSVAGSANDPTLVHSAVSRDLDPLSVQAEALEPAALGLGSGNLAVDVVEAQGSLLSNRVVFDPIAKVPDPASVEASALAPTIVMGSTARKMPLLGVVAKANAATLFAFDEGTKIFDLLSVQGIASAPSRTMGGRSAALTIPMVGAAAFDPAGVATGGPPATPPVLVTSSAALDPSWSGSGSRAIDRTDAEASALAPELVLGPKVVALPLLSASGVLVAPALQGDGVVEPGTPEVAAAALAPQVRLGLPASLVSTSASALEPTIVLERSAAVPLLEVAGTALEPEVDSPVVFHAFDVLATSAEALAPAACGCRGSELAHELPVLEVVAIAPRCTLVGDLLASDLELAGDVTTHIDFTETHDVLPNCQANQVGLRIDIPLRDTSGRAISLEGATDLVVWMTGPIGAPARRTAVVLGEPSNGVVRYVTQPGDLSQHGVWSAQATAVLANGERVWSRPTSFRVEANVGPGDVLADRPAVPRAEAQVFAPTIVFTP